MFVDVVCLVGRCLEKTQEEKQEDKKAFDAYRYEELDGPISLYLDRLENTHKCDLRAPVDELFWQSLPPNAQRNKRSTRGSR